LSRGSWLGPSTVRRGGENCLVQSQHFVFGGPKEDSKRNRGNHVQPAEKRFLQTAKNLLDRTRLRRAETPLIGPKGGGNCRNHDRKGAKHPKLIQVVGTGTKGKKKAAKKSYDVPVLWMAARRKKEEDIRHRGEGLTAGPERESSRMQVGGGGQ